jgi:uncharacterized protein YbaP (TraB family)
MGFLLAAPLAIAQQPDVPVLEEVLVTGEQPGPALWRVIAGSHVLWILGEVPQLPAEVTWRSRQLETVLATSQQVLLDGRIVWGPQTKQQRTALKKASELPRGQTLKDVLSPDLYARTEVARRAFARSERRFKYLQPYFASNHLIMNSMKPLGVAPFGASVTVTQMAQKLGVRVTGIQTVADFDAYVESIGNGSTTPCLEVVVATLAEGGAGVRALANAWAVGDIDELRRLAPLYAADSTNRRAFECSAALHGSERARAIAALHARKLLGAAEAALAANLNTVLVVPVGELFAPDGYLAALGARGYRVLEPL